MKKFVLRVCYGTGNAALIVNTPDIVEAIQIFKQQYCASLPECKEYGLPDIIKAELIPLLYDNTIHFKEQ